MVVSAESGQAVTTVETPVSVDSREKPTGTPEFSSGDTPSTGRGAPSRVLFLTTIALWVFVPVSLLAGWFAFYGLVLTGFVEHGTQFRLYGQIRAELAQETAPLGGVIKPGEPVAVLSFPALGLRRAVVVEGTTASQLTKGPGHLSDTPLPGQPGLSFIFGRSATFGGPFAGLTGLRAGETMTITTGQGTFVYRVDRVRRPGSAAPPQLQAGTSRITLVSSAASGWRSGWAPVDTVFADASLVKGKVQPAPAGVPSSVAKASRPMQGQRPPVFPLVLWLLGLLAVPIAATWSARRWGRWQTWVAGLPVLVALLWGATQSAELLLPNLI